MNNPHSCHDLLELAKLSTNALNKDIASLDQNLLHLLAHKVPSFFDPDIAEHKLTLGKV